MAERAPSIFETLRTDLGIPDTLRAHTVMRIRAFRGVRDTLLNNAEERIGRKVVEAALAKESKIEKRAIVDLTVQSLPEDFGVAMLECLNRDHERRANASQKGEVPTPLSGMGIQLHVLSPLTSAGEPVRGILRCALDPDAYEEFMAVARGFEVTDLEAIKHPAFYRGVITAEDDGNLPIFLRVTSGLDYLDETVPAVRQQLLAVLRV